MRILLAALNSKFTHSSLPLMSIANFCSIYEKHLNAIEFTINQPNEFIISHIFKENPEILCFSCYIWNIDKIKQIISSIRKLLPNTKIVLGGPEVSFEYNKLIIDKIADIIVIGEGEETFFELTEHFLTESPSLHDVNGIAFLHNNVCYTTPKRQLLHLDKIPFPYKDDTMLHLKDRIIYYESSRGCPFECAYCLSSIDKSIRFLSLERVQSDLKFFLDKKILKVKFIDRTFNCNAKRTEQIWNFLIENDNGITCFHFEICAELLTDKLLECLKKARQGLFQFEIGVQSTNPNTLKEINRITDSNKLLKTVTKIKQANNIHVHLDLIAGLPLENFDSFSRSFDDVYATHPDKLQLGFLKLLKGSHLYNKANFFGIVCDDFPPYTVLYTNELSFSDICILRNIEETIELFYNSHKFYYSLIFIMQQTISPFKFYLDFSNYLDSKKFFDISHNKLTLYSVFFDYCNIYLEDHIDILKELIIFDLYKHDKITKLPEFIERRHVNIKTSGRSSHIQLFYYNIIKWIENDFKYISKQETLVLFEYDKTKKGHASFKEEIPK